MSHMESLYSLARLQELHVEMTVTEPVERDKSGNPLRRDLSVLKVTDKSGATIASEKVKRGDVEAVAAPLCKRLRRDKAP